MSKRHDRSWKQDALDKVAWYASQCARVGCYGERGEDRTAWKRLAEHALVAGQMGATLAEVQQALEHREE